MLRKSIFRSGVVFVLLSCALSAAVRSRTALASGRLARVPAPITRAEERWRASQIENLCEAVFRDDIADHPGYTHYLSIFRKDPSAAFMRRFRGIPVRPASQFDRRRMRAPQKRRPPDFYSVSGIRWKSHSTADVDAAAMQNGRAGGFGAYHLVLQRGRWRVAGYTSAGIM
ncbi:MAG: hypothetical protein LC772_09835 [Chloroflexi bacterium]|nr:hypothetical protein [Chloroflexota bacterium]